MFVYAMTVGPVATNCYLLGDERTRTGAIIDPGANGKEIAEIAKQSGYQFDKVLLTHSHFDHITGLGELLKTGTTTCFDHHYVFPAGCGDLLGEQFAAAEELGMRMVCSRGSMDLSRKDGGRPRTAWYRP